MNIYTKLSEVQKELKAPKSQFNEFGKYSYRNAEDILEAVKPLCAKVGAIITLSDEMICVNARYYVKATAKFIDTESTDGTIQFIETTANAREEETKKGMDGSQITGSASSYARKYALNGLLCIDDTKDSDTTNKGDNQPKKNPYADIRDEDLPFNDVPPQEPKMTLEEAWAVEVKTKDGIKTMKELTNEQLELGLKFWNVEEWKTAANLVLLERQGRK